MAGKPFRCVIGFHSYIREHPRDERLHGPNTAEVCRLCGKRLGAPDVPPAVLGS